MLDRRVKGTVSTVLSSLIAVALNFNAAAQPVHAFAPSKLFSDPCPGSPLAVGKEKIYDVLAQFESVSEIEASPVESWSEADEENHIRQEVADQNQTDRGSQSAAEGSPGSLAKEEEGTLESQTLRSGENQGTEDSVVEVAVAEAPELNADDNQEGGGFWDTVINSWLQIFQLRLEIPEFSLREAREALNQILSLQERVPGLGFGEAREIWGQIRELRLEMPDLSFNQVQEVWDQISDLRLEMPDLKFEEAQEVWEQIRGLQKGMPDLSFDEAQEVWGQIGDMRLEMPDLKFEEAQEVWEQIRALQEEMPSLSFQDAKTAWRQIPDLQLEMPELSLEEAREIWQQIREFQVVLPDLSFEEAQWTWEQIQALRLELPSMSVGEAKEVLEQIQGLREEVPALSIEEASGFWLQIQRLSEDAPQEGRQELAQVWKQIRNLQNDRPGLSLEQAKAVWFELQRLRTQIPELSFEDAKRLWQRMKELQADLSDLNSLFALFIPRAEGLLISHGFDDTDGDGLLNWPEDSPFSDRNVDLEIIITEGAGIAIGFVPIGGDIVDGVAFVIGKDPYSGECLTKTEQILVALAMIPLLPISVKSVKIIGKQADKVSPLAKRILANSVTELPVSVRRWLVSGLVHPPFRGMRTIAGEGAATADELASSLGFSAFSNGNYRNSLLKFTGVSRNAAKGLEAHHILPKEFEERFVEHGIETIHDPRLLVWVDEVGHGSWSKDYGDAWTSFFEQTPRPTRLQILEEAQELAHEYGYEVLFKITN